MGQNCPLIPSFEGGTAYLSIVNFDASLDVLSNILKEGFLRLQLKKGGVDKVHAQDADSFLLDEVGSIPQVDMENDVVRWAARLQLEP